MKNNNIKFRPIQKSDAKELFEMLNNLSSTSKRFFHPHPFNMKTINEICDSEDDYFFILTLNDKIIGYSMLRFFGYKIPSFGCCIRKEYEGEDYGTFLTKETLKKAKDLGIKKIILKVYKDNFIAYNLYKKTGFKTVGENKETSEKLMEILL
jgi:RimJ/RimL family protein N-acetyltransferase